MIEKPDFLPFECGPIPKSLWSDYLEAPFDTCTACGRSLAEGLYEIQKVSNQRETIVEMAICLECSQALAAECSTQSIAAIQRFFGERLDLQRAEDRCNVCGERVSLAPTFSLCSLCSGQRLVFPVIRVCGRCEEAIQELLSDQTRRAHDDFLNSTLPGVPAGLDLAPKILL